MGSDISIELYHTAVCRDLHQINELHRGFAGPDKLTHRHRGLIYLHRGALRRPWWEVALLGAGEAAKYASLTTRFEAQDPELCRKEADAIVAYGAAGFPGLDASIVGNIAFLSLNASGTTCEEAVRLRTLFGQRLTTIMTNAEPKRSCYWECLR